MKPRLLIIGPFPPPYGGIANLTAQLAGSGLNELFAVRTLNISLRGEQTENTAEQRPVKPWKTVRALARMLGAVVRERPPFLLLEMNGDISCFREMMISMVYRLLGRTTIVTHFHGRVKERRTWRAFPFTRAGLRRLPDRLALNMAFAFTHRIVFLSPVLRDQFLGGLSVRNRRKATWVENFVDAAAYGTREQPPWHGPTVLFVGRLSQAKGFFDLVRAIPEVVGRHPGTVFSCCGAPETEEALREIQHLLDEYQRKGWLYLHGLVAGERKRRVFAQADLLVYPSHVDVFPVTVLEGLAQGLPIISTPVGVLPSILREPENTLFVPSGDPAMLARRLCLLLGDPALRRAMGEANRRLALERFDTAVAVRRFCALLHGQDPDSGRAGAEKGCP